MVSAPNRVWTSSLTTGASQPPRLNSNRIAATISWKSNFFVAKNMLRVSTQCGRGVWGPFGGTALTTALMNSTSGVSVKFKNNESNDSYLPPLPTKRTVVGVGTLTLDFLAKVEEYPEPDAKIRSIDSLAQGGGNVGNALTAAARLGLSPRVFSKVAKDSAGIEILKELEGDGVDVSYVVVGSYRVFRVGSITIYFKIKVADGGVSPFTYVIVDEKTKTRTCIHTPGYPPLEPDEYSSSAIASLLSGADLLYLDGRIPDAALRIAKEASKEGLPIIVDAERKREGLDGLLSYADYLVTSTNFPLVWTEAPTLGEALVVLSSKLPRLKFVIVTQGAAGCVMLERRSSENLEVLDVNQTLQSLWEEAKDSSEPTVFSSKVSILRRPDAGNLENEASCVARLLVGTADIVPPAELVDTTGAGDAFIGAVMYCLCAGLPPEKMLPIGSVVAAAKCRALGARTGLPVRGDSRVLQYLL